MQGLRLSVCSYREAARILIAAVGEHTLCCVLTVSHVQVDNGAAAAGSAAPAAMAPAIPGEPISLLLKESVIVILQKDGGVDNMEVQGTIALQVTAVLLGNLLPC